MRSYLRMGLASFHSFHLCNAKRMEKREAKKGNFGGKPYNPETDKAPVGRNEPCTCGSGKKFKKCCLGKEVDLC